jgi:hypothetical protein
VQAHPGRLTLKDTLSRRQPAGTSSQETAVEHQRPHSHADNVDLPGPTFFVKFHETAVVPGAPSRDGQTRRPRGSSWNYAGRWITRRGLVGPWSPIISFTVPNG